MKVAFTANDNRMKFTPPKIGVVGPAGPKEVDAKDSVERSNAGQQLSENPQNPAALNISPAQMEQAQRLATQGAASMQKFLVMVGLAIVGTLVMLKTKAGILLKKAIGLGKKALKDDIVPEGQKAVTSFSKLSEYADKLKKREDELHLGNDFAPIKIKLRSDIKVDEIKKGLTEIFETAVEFSRCPDSVPKITLHLNHTDGAKYEECIKKAFNDGTFSNLKDEALRVIEYIELKVGQFDEKLEGGIDILLNPIRRNIASPRKSFWD